MQRYISSILTIRGTINTPAFYSSSIKLYNGKVYTTSTSNTSGSNYGCAKRNYVQWTTSVSKVTDWTKNQVLSSWILDVIKLVQPERVHLCDGSDAENQELLTNMVHSGTLIKLNETLRPNSYYARSDASDVARVEERTFISTENKTDAGFTNNWRDSDEMMRTLMKLFEGCMRGRTMYVVPFLMGPVDSPFAQLGVQVTDSPYAVVNMRIMTNMGSDALKMLQNNAAFVPCLHSVGAPVARGEENPPWPCNKEKYIVHFPNQQKIFSYGSGYGGNALLGKKCYALRIASAMARDEGWLAEHMLIVGITNPQGVKKYVAAAFPSACGKTNLAMLQPKLPGWKVECIGDDIAWIRVGEDGRLWAVNPEAGFFGVAPGTSYDSNPMAMETIKRNTLFTNTALTMEGDVWWEGMTKKVPEKVISWLRTELTPDDASDRAHPNSRFTVSASQCPVLDPAYYNKTGVPLDAIIFGGRRSTTIPLVYQARNWEHGVFIGATMTSETTAAAAGKRGVLRADPFAMRPFCGYNMGDYFNHWISFQKRTDPSKLPKIFHVNWFRKSATGKFLWPGFGDNIRVLDWILQRCAADSSTSQNAVATPIGFVPTQGAINVEGLDMTPETMEALGRVDSGEWLAEIKKTKEFLGNFGDRLPKEISSAADLLEREMENQQTQSITSKHNK